MMVLKVKYIVVDPLEWERGGNSNEAFGKRKVIILETINNSITWQLTSNGVKPCKILWSTSTKYLQQH